MIIAVQTASMAVFSVSPNLAMVGQTITMTVAVNGSDPTGSVTVGFGCLSWVCEDVRR